MSILLVKILPLFAPSPDPEPSPGDSQYGHVLLNRTLKHARPAKLPHIQNAIAEAKT